jgi:hypothetical protein
MNACCISVCLHLMKAMHSIAGHDQFIFYMKETKTELIITKYKDYSF